MVSLRWRLTLFYTALLAVLLTVVAVAALYMMRTSLIRGLDRELQDTYSSFTAVASTLNLGSRNAQVVRDESGQPIILRYQFPSSSIQVEELSFYDLQSLTSELQTARTAPERARLLGFLRAMMNASRQVIAIDPTQPIRLEDQELIQLIEAPDGQLLMNRLVKETFKKEPTLMRVLVRLGPVQLHPAPLGSPEDTSQTLAVTYVGRSLDEISDTLAQLRSVIMLLFLAGLASAGTGAYLLAGQALSPLRQVQRAAERIGGQNLGERVPEPQTDDEVQALAQALNGMLGRLEQSFESQRRFTSDASHELRTPVTAISGHASYLLRRTSPTGQQAESLKIIQSESERLTNLIASLLQLARSDSGALVLNKAPIFSTLFLGEISRELAPLAQAQQTTLDVSGQDIPFEGDPDRLKQVIINLVGNALKAGARTVTLRSALEDGGTQVHLRVQDDGPGIPEDQLERLFDRFYRLEDSRSRDQGGAGLGLSIAKGIVDAHGGRIWLESTLGQGTTAHVLLPVGNVPVLDEDDVP
ncbi:HAMP domain-containing sensor histidine kinase [Deinococcus deserti]|uniref:histidine kinase n=1 Tax=Deinococcus deserti (strain DSM 17065 / CIP 109153 / LMG 22923 / VCD115) TaxID=546414 RepID=C1CYD6_DEIDV|nr:putative histidine kinase, classic; putative membrane protein [Deinococcus deserti VCD115]